MSKKSTPDTAVPSTGKLPARDGADRGKDAKKVELEKRLDHNAELVKGAAAGSKK